MGVAIPGHAQWIRDLRWESLPPAVKAQAKRCLKDLVGTAAGSLALPSAKSAEALVRAQFADGPARLWFHCSGAGFLIAFLDPPWEPCCQDARPHPRGLASFTLPQFAAPRPCGCALPRLPAPREPPASPAPGW